ncbi:MAG: hypothetical protein ABI140_08280 [Jatrophihabitantaceae bacterium]
MSGHIAIATCTQLLPDGDVEDATLLRALAELDLKATLVGWSEPDVDWAGFDATVIRSTWDYTTRRAEFLAWTDRVPRLFNPAPVVAANSDKRYLAGLAAAGLPVVRTTFFEPDQPVRLPVTGEYVLKPSIGAGSGGAGRFDAGQPADAQRASAHAAALQAAGRTVLLQPYLAGVDTAGETALMFFNGRYSHAICKSAMLAAGSQYGLGMDQLYVGEVITAREPSAAELELAGAVLAELTAGLPEPLLYARIDLLPAEHGPVLVEAELTEPSLFLDHDEQAARRLAEAISDRIG